MNEDIDYRRMSTRDFQSRFLVCGACSFLYKYEVGDP